MTNSKISAGNCGEGPSKKKTRKASAPKTKAKTKKTTSSKAVKKSTAKKVDKKTLHAKVKEEYAGSKDLATLKRENPDFAQRLKKKDFSNFDFSTIGELFYQSKDDDDNPELRASETVAEAFRGINIQSATNVPAAIVHKSDLSKGRPESISTYSHSLGMHMFLDLLIKRQKTN